MEAEAQRMEVVVEAGQRVLGEADAALRQSWAERGAREWVVGKQVDPGLWTSSAGAPDARTEFVSLRPWSLDDAADRLPPRGGKRSEIVATLVPGVEGSLREPVNHQLFAMTGAGAPGLVFVSTPVEAKCCKRMVAMLVNRYGRTRCLPCDADVVAS